MSARKKTREQRYKGLDKAFAGFTAVCARAARGDYRGALGQLGAMPDVPVAGTVVRDGLNIVLGSLVKCDHKFVDSKVCLKCGWRPPRREEDQEDDSLEEAQAQAAAADR